MDTAKSAGSFNTLVTAVQAAGLVDTLKGPGPFTVFAPTDEAFAKLPEHQLAILDLGKAPKGAKTAEGFMFPATYTVVEGGPVKNLVAKQLAAYRDNVAKVDMRYAKRKNLTRYDVLIIASLVEREAQLDKERPLIASVIYNRLKLGMPLGIDATIRYQTGRWDRPSSVRVSGRGPARPRGKGRPLRALRTAE